MPTQVHHLVADDNGVCQSQIRFSVEGSDRVLVLGVLGATQYINKEMSIDQARDYYRTRLNAGWVVPYATKALNFNQMMNIIND